MNILAVPPPKIKSQAKYLHEIVDDIVFGIKTSNGPRFVNTIERIKDLYDKNILWPQHPKKLTQKLIKAHIAKEQTVFYTSSWRAKSNYALANIDIDAHHGIGSSKGCWDFAAKIDSLLANLMPNLKGKVSWEASTNGNGVHGYLLIRRNGEGNGFICSLFKRLQSCLRHYAVLYNADIQAVEIKGQPARFDWTNSRPSIKFGTLAKLPRSDISNTAVISFSDLTKLPIEYDTASDPDPVKAKKKTRIMSCGSCCPMPDASEELPKFKEYAEKIHESWNWNCKHGRKVEVEDVQALAYCVWFCTNNMNEDGTMPTERIKALWTWLYETEQVSRPYDPTRYTALRNGFTALGLLLWEDNTYVVGVRSCKWQGSDTFVQACGDILREKREESIFICSPIFLPQEIIRPVRIIRPVTIFMGSETGFYEESGIWRAAG